jgi:hypothetical protein
MARALTAIRGPVWQLEPAMAPAMVGGRGLHVCTRCRHHFCLPVDWEPSSESSWRIELRCAQCGHEREACASNDEAAAFDLELDRHEAAMAAAADALDRERLEAQVEVFAAALSGDLIGADDFAC